MRWRGRKTILLEPILSFKIFYSKLVSLGLRVFRSVGPWSEKLGVMFIPKWGGERHGGPKTLIRGSASKYFSLVPMTCILWCSEIQWPGHEKPKWKSAMQKCSKRNWLRQQKHMNHNSKPPLISFSVYFIGAHSPHFGAGLAWILQCWVSLLLPAKVLVDYIRPWPLIGGH